MNYKTKAEPGRTAAGRGDTHRDLVLARGDLHAVALLQTRTEREKEEKKQSWIKSCRGLQSNAAGFFPPTDFPIAPIKHQNPAQIVLRPTGVQQQPVLQLSLLLERSGRYCEPDLMLLHTLLSKLGDVEADCAPTVLRCKKEKKRKEKSAPSQIVRSL